MTGSQSAGAEKERADHHADSSLALHAQKHNCPVTLISLSSGGPLLFPLFSLYFEAGTLLAGPAGQDNSVNAGQSDFDAGSSVARKTR